MAAASTAASEVSDGPVLSLINKRLRALRKKLNRITQMEEAIANGKPINKEQEEVLRSKTAIVALIDELEKLRQPLSEAVAEEISLISAEPKTDSAPAPTEPAAVEDLMSLLYFGSLFDVKPQSDFAATMLTRTHERGCCLTYDYVTDDATDPLREADLDSISRLGGLLVSRPVDSSLSHKDALLKCIEHAKLWLARSEELVDPSADITYSGLRERLAKIVASDYMTTTPEMKAPVEVAAAFQVPIEAPVLAPVQVESSAPQFQQDKATTEFEDHKQIENQSSAVEEFHQACHQEEWKPEAEYEPAEPVAAEQEQTQLEAEFESKDRQHGSRRSYQNQRGGGSRGGGRRGTRGNSRGGRTYQNGGYHQDQQQGGGGYYPRNNNYYNNSNRGGGGGGRGGRGGGPAYNNDGSASVGVGS